MKIVKLEDRKNEEVKFRLEDAIEMADQFDEILIIGKMKDSDGYKLFRMEDPKSVFWWIGALTVAAKSLDEKLLGNPHEYEEDE